MGAAVESDNEEHFLRNFSKKGLWFLPSTDLHWFGYVGGNREENCEQQSDDNDEEIESESLPSSFSCGPSIQSSLTRDGAENCCCALPDLTSSDSTKETPKLRELITSSRESGGNDQSDEDCCPNAAKRAIKEAAVMGW